MRTSNETPGRCSDGINPFFTSLEVYPYAFAIASTSAIRRMSTPHPFHVLKDVGLPEKEASIYVTLLGQQRMSVAELSRSSGIKRATCYEHLDQLLLKGFVRRNPIGKRMLYSAVEPKRVLADFKKKTELLEKSVEEMTQIHESAINKPKITYYEGKREIRSIYEDIFKTVGDTYSIFPPATFFENFTEEDYSEFDRSIGQYALKSRDLFVPDRYYKKIKEIREKNGTDNKYDKKLPPWFTCNVDVLIYSDKVALISLRDLSGIVIENRDIADLFKNLHGFLWKFS
jgi:sugar-specific transcriptional regulator TrmB